MNSLSRFTLPSLFDLVGESNHQPKTWLPAISIHETETAYLVEAEIPGIPAHLVDVALVGSVLVLKGERQSEIRRDDGHGKTLHLERSYGSFQRQVRLPNTIDPEKVTATAKDGVLTVSVGKRDLPKKIKVDVKSE